MNCRLGGIGITPFKSRVTNGCRSASVVSYRVDWLILHICDIKLRANLKIVKTSKRVPLTLKQILGIPSLKVLLWSLFFEMTPMTPRGNRGGGARTACRRL